MGGTPKPIAPHLDPHPADWDGTVEATLEIDRALVREADFADITRLSVDASRLESVQLTGVALDKLEVSDSVLARLEAAALQTYRANLLRVELSDCRLTGAEFAEAQFEDCVFRSVQCDGAGFRFAHFKRVRFEHCLLRRADFGNATFAQITFAGCDLAEANFTAASCRDTDITGEAITAVKGVLGLKGATISGEQLMQLAPLLAAELGFKVSY